MTDNEIYKITVMPALSSRSAAVCLALLERATNGKRDFHSGDLGEIAGEAATWAPFVVEELARCRIRVERRSEGADHMKVVVGPFIELAEAGNQPDGLNSLMIRLSHGTVEALHAAEAAGADLARGLRHADTAAR